MGKTWSTISYQAIKSDAEGWWSAALAEWELFDESNKDAWRAAAPYQATYNDMGKIFFGLIRILYQSMVTWGTTTFGLTLMGESDYSLAAVWWARALVDVFRNNGFDGLNSGMTYTGTWETVAEATSYLGSYQKSANASGQSFEFFFIGKYCRLGFPFLPTSGSLDVYVNGEFHSTVNQYNATPIYGAQEFVYLGQRLLYHVRCERVSGSINFDFIAVSDSVPGG